MQSYTLLFSIIAADLNLFYHISAPKCQPARLSSCDLTPRLMHEAPDATLEAWSNTPLQPSLSVCPHVLTQGVLLRTLLRLRRGNGRV